MIGGRRAKKNSSGSKSNCRERERERERDREKEREMDGCQYENKSCYCSHEWTCKLSMSTNHQGRQAGVNTYKSACNENTSRHYARSQLHREAYKIRILPYKLTVSLI